MIVPVLAAIGALAAGAYYAIKEKVLTPFHAAVLQKTLEQKDTQKLKEASQIFKSQGYIEASRLIDKRVLLRDLSPEVKKARKEALRAALKSTDVKAILGLADQFEKEGATGAAARLRQYGNALKPS